MKRTSDKVSTKGRAQRSAGVAIALIGGTAALGLATVGGALSSAPGARQLQPDSQFPVMAFDMAPAGQPMDQPELPGETVLFKTAPMHALAKADRMALPIKLALAGSASYAREMSAPVDMHAPHPIAYSVVVQPGYENESYVMPGVAYASLELHDGATRFDQATGSEPMGAMPIHPAETPEIAEEEDDAQPTTLAVPLPQAKPILDPSLPLPKMRPELPPVAAMPNAGRIPPSKPGVLPPNPGSDATSPGAIPILRQPAKPSSILAFLTPQGEAQQPEAPPPITQPPNTIMTPTPFGIPYVLQTQTVDTACLKPELLEILRQVETHYGRKVVITSGYRSRGREGSLHRTCSAADIIVPGISSQALATYARTISAVGGVGTYCHQSMIHVDIGTPRDWKYGCGSYFAMRDGSAHWGKVPQSIED